jgi:hypothetical protein
MAWYDDRDGTMKLTNPNAFGRPGSNGKVVRVVVHVVGTPGDAALNNMNQAQICWNTWNGKSTSDFHVSAHFCIERDGRVIQFVDTNDIAYGTGWLTGGSVHIEHAGNHPHEMTDTQLHNSADLVGWLKMMHQDISLELTGTSIKDYGDPTRPGITCHRFIQEAYHRLKPDAAIEWRACPGDGIIGQLPDLLRLAKMCWSCMYA